jgi:hypothetical protein
MDGAPVEVETFTCHHCGQVVFVDGIKDPTELGGGCRLCDHLICKDCVQAAWNGKTCDVYEKKMARIEAAYHARRNYEEAMRS